LSKLPETTPEAITKALKVYEEVRRERAYTLVELAAASGRALHLGDGKAKEERDAAFKALKEGKGPVPDKWADAGRFPKIGEFTCLPSDYKPCTALSIAEHLVSCNNKTCWVFDLACDDNRRGSISKRSETDFSTAVCRQLPGDSAPDFVKPKCVSPFGRWAA
jgi:hypothetical protein